MLWTAQKLRLGSAVKQLLADTCRRGRRVGKEAWLVSSDAVVFLAGLRHGKDPESGNEKGTLWCGGRPP